MIAQANSNESPWLVAYSISVMTPKLFGNAGGNMKRIQMAIAALMQAAATITLPASR